MNKTVAVVLLLSLSSGVFPGTGMSTARRTEPVGAGAGAGAAEAVETVGGRTAFAFANSFKTTLTSKVLEMLAADRVKGRPDVPSDDEMSAGYVVHDFTCEADIARLSEVVASGKKTIVGAISDAAILQNPVFIDALKALSWEDGVLFYLVVPSCAVWTEAVEATMDERGVSALAEAFKTYNKSIMVLEQSGDDFDASVEALAATSTEIDARSAPDFKAYDLSAGVYDFMLLRNTKKSIAVKNSSFCDAKAWISDSASPEYAEGGVERLEACASMAVDLLFRQDTRKGEDITTYALSQTLKKRYPDKSVVVVGHTNLSDGWVSGARGSIFVTAQSNVERFAAYLRGQSYFRYAGSVLVVRGSADGFFSMPSISTIPKSSSTELSWKDLVDALDRHFGAPAH